MKWSVITVVLISALLLSVVPTYAQSKDLEGKAIRKVSVEGNSNVPTSTILHYLRTQPGESLDSSLVDLDIKNLWETGLFEDIHVTAKPSGETVELTFVFQEKPVIRSIRYTGLKSLKEDGLVEELEKRDALLKRGALYDKDKITRTMRAIEQVLRDKGKRTAQVDVETKDISDLHKDVTFNVTEGVKHEIDKIEIVGNTVFSDRKLKRTLKNTREHWMFSWITRKDVYSEAKYAEDIEAVKTLYRNAGYADVQIKEPIIHSEDKKGAIRRSKIEKRMFVTIEIVEGVQYRVGNLDVAGNSVFTKEQILARIGLIPGEIFNHGMLIASLGRIQEDYGILGYFYAAVTPIPDLKEDQTVDILLQVQEDKIYYLNQIEFAGNHVTRDKVLRREFRISEGDTFNTVKFRTGLQKIFQLGFFDGLEPEIKKTPGTEDWLDVTLNVEESNKNEIRVGGGFSGFDGFFGSVSYSTLNLLGRGQTLEFSITAGGRNNLYSVSLTEPYLFDRRIYSSASVFHRQIEFIDFDRESTGGILALGRWVGNFSLIQFRYNYEVIDVTFTSESLQMNQTNDFSSSFFGTEGTVSSITPIFVRSTIDNPINPIRGTKVRGSVEVAGPGGNLYFIKPRLSGTIYHPFTYRWGIGANAELQYLTGWNSEEVPFFERFFIGGEYDLRGFPLRSISPEDEDGNLIGGTRSAVLNFENIIRFNRALQGVMFFDAGNSWGDDEDVDFASLRTSAGLELRVFIPIFRVPIRFIYAWNLDPEPDEDKTDFIFSIGTTF